MGIGWYPRRTETAVVEVAVVVSASSENSTEAVQRCEELVGEPEDAEDQPSTPFTTEELVSTPAGAEPWRSGRCFSVCLS